MVRTACAGFGGVGYRAVCSFDELGPIRHDDFVGSIQLLPHSDRDHAERSDPVG